MHYWFNIHGSAVLSTSVSNNCAQSLRWCWSASTLHCACQPAPPIRQRDAIFPDVSWKSPDPVKPTQKSQFANLYLRDCTEWIQLRASPTARTKKYRRQSNRAATEMQNCFSVLKPQSKEVNLGLHRGCLSYWHSNVRGNECVGYKIELQLCTNNYCGARGDKNPECRLRKIDFEGAL